MAPHRRTLITAFAVAALILPGPALAKKKGKKKKKKRDDEIVLTGYRSFDKVFRQVDSIDERLDVADKAMKSAKRDLNLALDLKRGTPLTDALEELKITGEGYLGVAMEGKVPTLVVDDLAPSNVVEAVDAVNGMTSSLVTSLDELAGIPDDLDKLQKQIARFPERARKDFAGDPIGALFKAPKLIKTIQGNLELTASLPGRTADITGRATSLLTLVGTEFAPANLDGSAGKGGRGGRTTSERTGGSGGSAPRGARPK